MAVRPQDSFCKGIPGSQQHQADNTQYLYFRVLALLQERATWKARLESLFIKTARTMKDAKVQ